MGAQTPRGWIVRAPVRGPQGTCLCPTSACSITVYRYNCLIHRQVNHVDRFDSEFATEDPYATGKQSGGTVFGVDALADLLGATTEDQMGSRDLNGVARGPCRTCR